ncbi:MAG: molybdopterin-synthase adenylyltransferase MoeB [Candidatus Hadarchaeales archaeon]
MVKINVKFSVMFKNLVGVTADTIETEEDTVRGLLNALILKYGPQLGERVLDAKTGGLRRFVNIFVNGKDIRNLQALETKLKDGDEVRLIPAVAGGSEFLGFTQDQIVRYSRQILLKEIGGRGQRKLLESKVLVVGAGGLGSPASLYLAAAGVGKLGIVDGDGVDLSNLNRQILHSTEDVGRPKVESAKEAIEKLNPDVDVITYNLRLSPENAQDVIGGWDFVIDCSDNFPTKFLVNDACVLEGVPFSHAGVLRFIGMTMTILPRKGPCYRCLTPEAPPPGMIPTCQEAGVLGAVPGIIGTIQAAEALKYLLGEGKLLVGRVLFFDASEMKFEEFELQRDQNCPACGNKPTITELSRVDYGHVCEVRF